MQHFLATIADELKQLDSGEFWLGFTVVAALAAYAFWRMVCWFQHARLIENIPTARIRSAPQGYIEIIGKARPMDGPVIVSPLSGSVCLWYRYKIEEKVREVDGKGRFRSRWRLVKKHTSDELFLLQDDTGQCVIDPDDAEVITRDTRVWYNRTVYPVRRYTETLILEGDPLYAMGLFKSVATVEDQKIRHQVSLLLRQWKQDPNLMLDRYDSDHDGTISPAEWQQARADAAIAVKREIGQRAKLQQLSVLTASPVSSQPYILSTVSEKTLIKRYQLRAFGAMLAFLSLGSMLVWACNQRMGL